MRTLIKHVLAAAGPQDNLCVSGWVRTRRDAKGFSFLELNDGSCLANVQVVIDAPSPAAELDPVHHRRFRRGRRQAGPLPRRRAEMGTARHAARADWRGRCRLSAAEKGAQQEFLRTIAHLRPRSNLLWRGVPHAQPAGLCRAPVLPGTRFRLHPHADYHGQRLRRRGRDVPRDHAQAGNIDEKPAIGFLRQTDLPDGQRPA